MSVCDYVWPTADHEFYRVDMLGLFRYERDLITRISRLEAEVKELEKLEGDVEFLLDKVTCLEEDNYDLSQALKRWEPSNTQEQLLSEQLPKRKA